jgi:hypothetical protein
VSDQVQVAVAVKEQTGTRSTSTKPNQTKTKPNQNQPNVNVNVNDPDVEVQRDTRLWSSFVRDDMTEIALGVVPKLTRSTSGQMGAPRSPTQAAAARFEWG